MEMMVRVVGGDKSGPDALSRTTRRKKDDHEKERVGRQRKKTTGGLLEIRSHLINRTRTRVRRGVEGRERLRTKGIK